MIDEHLLVTLHCQCKSNTETIHAAWKQLKVSHKITEFYLVIHKIKDIQVNWRILWELWELLSNKKNQAGIKVDLI